MSVQKILVSLPLHLYDFIEKYQVDHHLKSRSEVISEALILLEQDQLEASYLAASKELDQDWDVTIAEGLDDEAW